MSPEAIAIAVAVLSVATNIVVGIIGWFAKNALTGLQTKLETLVASQTATEKIVAVMEVRLGGEVAQLKARLDVLERSRTGGMRAVSDG